MDDTFTDILFAQPTIISGVARNVDIMGIYDTYNYMPSPEMADNIAIAGDWKTIINDLNIVIENTGINVARK